jgi:ABC-type lipoprotein release transport system permease subunit
VVIVNEAFVRRFIGGQPAIGREVISKGFGGLGTMLVVGVVNDAVYRNVRAGWPPTIYLPMSQAPAPGAEIAVTVRLAADPSTTLRGVGDAISRADPALAFSFRDFDDQVRATVLQERLVAMLSGFFGALALLLSGLGLYGVTSYSVNRRRAEIAVRIALGANADGVVRLVLRRVGSLLLFGVVVGLGLTLWLAKFVGALLFGVGARDPVMLATAVAVLLGVGLLAGWLPARRASRLDPIAVLRT